MAPQAVVKLRDGRLLSYRLAGYPVKSTRTENTMNADAPPPGSKAWGSKPTVVYHHGWPSSAAEVLAWDKPPAEQGVHMVAVDRPGVGFSTINPDGALQ
jgi:pimeloyl-ACP methyl ester carboxylesterase